MIDKGKLLQRIQKFRKDIEPSWSDRSAYKIDEVRVYGPYISGGQCAVTCLVLKGILEEEFPGLHCQLVSGSLETVEDEVLIRDHGWLIVHANDDELVIDPTADQAESIHDKVIVGTVFELEAKSLRYKQKVVEQDYGETEHPKRFARYQILKNAYDKRPG